MIYQLNLPRPSDALINAVLKAADGRPTNWASKESHERVQGPGINCAAGDFFLDEQVAYLARRQFQKYFPYKLFPVIGLIKNTAPETLASYCPHTDRIRTVGINYYIEAGGQNVTTVFYDKEDPIDDLVGGHMATYKDLNKINEQHFNEDIWYMFGTRRFHSVENIERVRIILTLSLNNCTTEDLVKLIENYGTTLTA
jgi:hypothetical protein